MFLYAGMQVGHECYCGNSYGDYGPATNCDRVCQDDNTQMCGGSYANTVVQINGKYSQMYGLKC